MTLVLKKPLIYVTRDIERALGMEPKGSYSIVSNNTPYGRTVQKQYPENVFLIDAKTTYETLDTYDLLLHPDVQKIIDTHNADIVVFQNTPRIERLAHEMHWNLINPSAELAKKVEEKISQISWLEKDADLLPPHQVSLVKDVVFTGKKFVLQFNHTHTGQGTHVISSADELNILKTTFPNRECRIVDFIEGPVYTINVSVNRLFSIVGSPSYQITGLSPFTDLPFSTIGNDWSLPTRSEIKEITRIARVVARRLKKASWRGLFGIDVIKDFATGNIYLLEINARQAASVVFESTLQKNISRAPSLFECHIAGLLGYWFPLSTSYITQGAQIVSRVTNTKHSVDVAKLRAQNLTVTEYENTIHNKELFRIQSTVGIMKSHTAFNDTGLAITSCIK